MKTIFISLLIVSAMMFTGCHNHKVDANNHDNHIDDENYEHFIHFSKEQAHLAELTVEIVSLDTFTQVIKTSGEILSSQSDETTISSTTNGIVSFSKESIAPGTAVRAGETIITVSAKSLPDGDPVVKSKIIYETALKEYKRASTLVKDQIISEKEFEQKRSDYESAKLLYQAQASSYSSNGIRITSSISGFVKNLFVGQGDFVSVGQPIATISRNKRLQLRAELSEMHYKSILSINDANFKLPYEKKLYKLSELNGRLISHGRTYEGKSFFIPVTFEFDNIGNIIPGSFAEIYLLSIPLIDVISVPVSSITEEQGLHFVYLKIDDESFKKQEVTLGETDGSRVLVNSGLKEGDSLVTNGVYQVKLAAKPSVMPKGHIH